MVMVKWAGKMRLVLGLEANGWSRGGGDDDFRVHALIAYKALEQRAGIILGDSGVFCWAV